MLLHNEDTTLNNIIHSLFHIIENGKPECAQKTIEPEVGVQQVFHVIHQVKVMHNVLELCYPPYQWWCGLVFIIFIPQQVGIHRFTNCPVKFYKIKTPLVRSFHTQPEIGFAG